MIPFFLLQPNVNNTRIVGENISFSCESYAIPAPSITWLKDGVALDLSVTSLSVSFTAGVNTNASVLFLGALNFSDSSQYSCRAENNLVSSQNKTSAFGTLTVNCEILHDRYMSVTV